MKFQKKNFTIRKIMRNKGRSRNEKYILMYSLGFFKLELKDKTTKKRISFSSKSEAQENIEKLIFKQMKIGIGLNFKLCIYA